MRRKIFKTGHSLAITVSKRHLDAVGLALGDSVETEIDGNKSFIIIKPAGRQRQLDLGLKARPKLGNRLNL